MRLLRTLLRSRSLPFLLPLCLLLYGSPTQAQQGFQTFLPDLLPAAKRPIVETPDGGFCVLALEEKTKKKIAHFVLVKVAAGGAVEWARKYSRREDSDDYPTALRATPDGGFLAVGTTTVPGSGEQKIMVLRLNRQGYPLWNKTYRHSDIDWAADAVVLDDGSAVIVGSTSVADSFLISEERWNEETEEFEETGNSVYNFTSHTRPFALRIAPDGEVVWGGFVKEPPYDEARDDVQFYVSYAQAVCRREGNAVTLLAQITDHYDSPYAGFAVTVTDDGEASSGLWLPNGSGNTKSGEWWPKNLNDYQFSWFVNDLAPTPDDGCLLSGTTRFGTHRDLGRLIRLDSRDTLLWSRVYTTGEPFISVSRTIAPFGDDRYLAGGYTTEFGYDEEYPQNPVLAIINSAGEVEEGMYWIPSLKKIPVRQSGKSRMKPYLRHPFFLPTDDRGIVSAATVRLYDAKADPELKPVAGDAVGMLIARFAPDFSLCTDSAVENVEIDLVDEANPNIDMRWNYWVDEEPIDQSPQDFRKGAGRKAPPQIILPTINIADMAPIIEVEEGPNETDYLSDQFDEGYPGTAGSSHKMMVSSEPSIPKALPDPEDDTDENMENEEEEEEKKGNFTRIDLSLEKLEITAASPAGLKGEKIVLTPTTLCPNGSPGR